MISTVAICLALLCGTLRFVSCQQTNYSCEIRPSQAYTRDKLQNLRTQMINVGIYAYVIFSGDEHLSEYVQPYDERRAWITGFLGSAGTAVVTRDHAALWTDGRYWTQAEDELDCNNWFLMRQGRQGVPSVSAWLASQVNSTAPYNRVGVAAQFISSNSWSTLNNAVLAKGASLVEVVELIDRVWVSGRPQAPANNIFVHDQTYAGVNWDEKVQTIARLIVAKKASGFLVSLLDEVAWLFNIRGSDIPYNPFFKAYAFVHANGTTRLWMNDTQLTPDAKIQLNTALIQPYNNFLSDLLKLANSSDITTVWISQDASQAIFSRIPTNKRLVAASPVELTKAIKNPIEEKGMRNCGIRDGVARVRHLSWLENEIGNDRIVNETQAAEALERFQSEEALFQTLSFDSISAFGANAAVIHYSPHPKTAARITKNGTYLLDAGAQYLDCTTDVTRTHVFGTPTEQERKAYTLVLQGSIDLADAVFPAGTFGRHLDILARKSLYKNFMDYNHGTGHGIGHFLSVHEGPSSISMGYNPSDLQLTDGMVFSDEPGFYLPNSFGIRLETDIIVKNYTLPVNYVNTSTQFLRFEMLTLVPFEHNLIVCSMLTEAQLAWLNQYHADVKSKLEATGRLSPDELSFLVEKTRPLIC